MTGFGVRDQSGDHVDSDTLEDLEAGRHLLCDTARVGAAADLASRGQTPELDSPSCHPVIQPSRDGRATMLSCHGCWE